MTKLSRYKTKKIWFLYNSFPLYCTGYTLLCKHADEHPFIPTFVEETTAEKKDNFWRAGIIIKSLLLQTSVGKLQNKIIYKWWKLVPGSGQD